MTKLVETAQTALTPEAAFAEVAAFENIDRWDPGVIRSVKRTSGETGVGTIYDLDLRYGKRKLQMAYTIVEYRPGQRVVLHGEGPMIDAVDTISVEAAGSGTVVTYEADLKLTGIGRLFQPFMGSRFAALGSAAGSGLRKWLGELERIRA